MIKIDWQKNDRFNILLSKTAEDEPYLNIRGCKIVHGEKGDFVSFPASKNEQTNKWWNHVTGSTEFQEHVISLARKSRPEPPKAGPAKKAADDDDINW